MSETQMGVSVAVTSQALNFQANMASAVINGSIDKGREQDQQAAVPPEWPPRAWAPNWMWRPEPLGQSCCSATCFNRSRFFCAERAPARQAGASRFLKNSIPRAPLRSLNPFLPSAVGGCSRTPPSVPTFQAEQTPPANHAGSVRSFLLLPVSELDARG